MKDEETKEFSKEKMKGKLEELYAQFSRSNNPDDRRLLDIIGQQLPLYNKHDFWDTQPVPKVDPNDVYLYKYVITYILQPAKN